MEGRRSFGCKFVRKLHLLSLLHVEPEHLFPVINLTFSLFCKNFNLREKQVSKELPMLRIFSYKSVLTLSFNSMT